MIHQAGYVKELIKKYIEGSITGVELEQLKACWKIYEENELLDMTAEVLYTAGKQEPGDVLKEWKPDFVKIISDTQRIRGNKKRLLYGKMAGAACLLLVLVMAVNHFIFRKWPGSYATSGCEDMTSRGEIPKSEFSCTVRWGDTTALTVDSSTTGLVTQINNFDIRQEAPGILAVTILPGKLENTAGVRFVQMLTAARRQYIIKLPGSISIHLDAGSSMKLLLVSTGEDTCYVQLCGEAYIKMPGKGKPGRLIVETSNSQLQTVGGSFAVLALPGYTKATLISGSAVAFSRSGIHSKKLDCPRDQTVVKSYAGTNDTAADSLFFKRNGDIKEALVWTKATRNYRNVSLRQFVVDMSRWCGFTVENLNCIPEQLRINTSICYRASRQQVYSEIRRAGIMVYEKDEGISFCNPGRERQLSLITNRFQEKGK